MRLGKGGIWRGRRVVGCGESCSVGIISAGWRRETFLSTSTIEGCYPLDGGRMREEAARFGVFYEKVRGEVSDSAQKITKRYLTWENLNKLCVHAAAVATAMGNEGDLAGFGARNSRDLFVEDFVSSALSHSRVGKSRSGEISKSCKLWKWRERTIHARWKDGGGKRKRDGAGYSWRTGICCERHSCAAINLDEVWACGSEQSLRVWGKIDARRDSCTGSTMW